MNEQGHQTASVIQRAVQAILSRGLNDPRVRGLISVTKVELSNDKVQATIFVSILPEEHTELTMHGLKHAEKHIRFQVAQDVRLRRLPRFVFKLDKTLKKQAAVFEAIATAKRRDGRADDGIVEEPLAENPNPEVSES